MKQLYIPTGINSHFVPPSSGQFIDYVNHYRQIIKQARQQLDFYATAQAIDYVSPFEWRKGSEKYGILMLHGLMESPFLTRDMAQYFYHHNYLIRSLLLPGHGTAPGDLLDVSAKQWEKCCHFSLNTMINDSQLDGFYLIGISTGANFSLLAGYQQKIEKLKGIILISPALHIRYYRPIYNKISRLLSCLFSRAQWIEKYAEKDFARYYSLPFNAAEQVYLLAQKLEHKTNDQLPCPLFMAVSSDDAIVSYQHNLNYFKQQKNPNNRMIVYSSKQLSDQGKRISFINSRCDKEHILNYPHIGLHTSPSNFHYGRDGDYQIVLKNDAKQKFYGEVGRSQVTHRLSYNPKFDHLMEHIQQFIER